MAGIFQQLHAAGTKVQGKQPFGDNQGPAATSHGVRSVVQLPEAERQERVDTQRRVVASGTPDSVLDMVATAISGSTATPHHQHKADARKHLPVTRAEMHAEGRKRLYEAYGRCAAVISRAVCWDGPSRIRLAVSQVTYRRRRR